MSDFFSALQVSPEHTVAQWAGMSLFSHFQPIYSLSHTRVVGHEALVRAHNAHGQPVTPLEIFQACSGEEELARCDSLSRTVHVANFAATLPQGQWLFLNVHPDVFHQLCREEGDGSLGQLIKHFNIAGERLVLEVLESAVQDPQAFEASIDVARRLGCLIAIDDFGAGHSNFDRVWRFRPDIVKLDRSLVERAAHDRRAQRVVSQMVALLHECGALVLMEGVETLNEALLAMESDSDMVQGYFFGRPQPELIPSGHTPESLGELNAGLGQRRQVQRRNYRSSIGPYRHAIGNAGVLLSAGRSIGEACRDFLALPGAELCYLLDANGYQIEGNHWRNPGAVDYPRGFEPLRESEGACWARRSYFRRAVGSIGAVQITRPYRSLNGNQTCVTISFAFHLQKGDQRELRVICGDLMVEGLALNPDLY